MSHSRSDGRLQTGILDLALEPRWKHHSDYFHPASQAPFPQRSVHELFTGLRNADFALFRHVKSLLDKLDPRVISQMDKLDSSAKLQMEKLGSELNLTADGYFKNLFISDQR
jgi:hypothetical protein